MGTGQKSNVDFAFVRISYGLNHLDKTYDYNMKQAEKAGVPTGTYVYSLALNTQQALKEAQLAIRKMDGYKYPIRWFMTLNMIRCVIFPHHRSRIWQKPSAMR